MVKLNVQKISEKEIVIALLDAGMDTEKINEFIESINSEYFQKSKNILLSQRAELLLKIRDGQEKLYCLDDYVDNFIEVENGDVVKLIGVYGIYAYVIKAFN